MVDIHCHILPGLDDGPATMDGAVEIGRVAEAAGIRTVVATPHIRDDYPFPLEMMDERLEDTQAAFRDAGLDLELVRGGEVALSKVPQLDDTELERFCVGTGPYLLVEAPHTQAPSLLETVLFDLQSRGFRPVLAHPERSVSFLNDPARLERLVESGVLCSVTALSMAGGFGGPVRAFCARLFEAGVVHNVASDAHDAVRRGPGFDRAFECLEADFHGGAEGQEWFTAESGRAIVEGRDLPPGPPALSLRPSGWRRLRGRVGLA